MNALDALKEIMTNREVTVTQLANRLGKSRSSVSDKFLTDKRQKSIKVDILCEFLRVLDYKIVLMPKDARLPKDSYEVE
jgi:DNA-binding Xre family transcriptional regulator